MRLFCFVYTRVLSIRCFCRCSVHGGLKNVELLYEYILKIKIKFHFIFIFPRICRV